jgi:DNA-binding protein HU-beta
MTKAELVDAVAESSGLTKQVVNLAISATFAEIARAIREEKRFSMPGFGTFSVRRHRARRGFNPNTRSPMKIPALRTIGFRPAPRLRKGL